MNNGESKEVHGMLCAAHTGTECDPTDPECLLFEASAFAVYVEFLVSLEITGTDQGKITRQQAMSAARKHIEEYMQSCDSAHSVTFTRGAAVPAVIH